jgi:hypothetical protein
MHYNATKDVILRKYFLFISTSFEMFQSAHFPLAATKGLPLPLFSLFIKVH